LKARQYILLISVMLLIAGCNGPVMDNEALPTYSVPQDFPPTLLNPTLPEKLPTLISTSTQSGLTRLEIIPANTKQLARYGTLELSLHTDLQAENPYDADEIDLRVVLQAPSGEESDVGAFWYQDYDLQTHQQVGEPSWRVRFTPDEAGEWTAIAYTLNPGLRSEIYSFSVGESSKPGFMRINPNNPRYLAFDNGDSFFPIGLNMGWWCGTCDPIETYSRWLKIFSANGGNTIRIWMAAWSFGIEWKDTGLGNYDHRQYEAWLLDQLLHLADQYDVKIILVLMNHGPLSLYTNTEWKDNPYNAALGGPLTSPGEFVTDPTAISYYQRRLNYIINRWSYSPAILAWEWFNEVDLTMISEQELAPWIQQMTAFLQQRDVNHHLTTSSYAMWENSPIWQLPELDIVQKHEYSGYNSMGEHDLAGRAAQDLQLMEQTIPVKPVLMGEFGYSAANYGEDVETTGIHLHNGLWATTFSGYAGSGMYWWWDNYVEANHLWYHFKGLSSFLQGENLADYQPFSLLDINTASGSTAEVDGIGLKGEKILVWLRSDAYTTQASIATRAGGEGSLAYQPPLVENLLLRLRNVEDGEYSIQWYDPQRAIWLEAEVVNAQDSTLSITVPAFRDDLAAKIIPIR
jgi:hypothetical protein